MTNKNGNYTIFYFEIGKRGVPDAHTWKQHLLKKEEVRTIILLNKKKSNYLDWFRI